MRSNQLDKLLTFVDKTMVVHIYVNYKEMLQFIGEVRVDVVVP